MSIPDYSSKEPHCCCLGETLPVGVGHSIYRINLWRSFSLFVTRIRTVGKYEDSRAPIMPPPERENRQSDRTFFFPPIFSFYFSRALSLLLEHDTSSERLRVHLHSGRKDPESREHTQRLDSRAPVPARATSREFVAQHFLAALSTCRGFGECGA